MGVVDVNPGHGLGMGDPAATTSRAALWWPAQRMEEHQARALHVALPTSITRLWLCRSQKWPMLRVFLWPRKPIDALRLSQFVEVAVKQLLRH